jgi:Rod binding domain-containing protein
MERFRIDTPRATAAANAPRPQSPERERAEATAGQFEQMFVRTLVSSLRQTATLGDGSMFGSGPGADTYGDWFDQNLAERLSATADIGIREQLLADLERHGEIPAAAEQVRRQAAERAFVTATEKLTMGGLDVLR